MAGGTDQSVNLSGMLSGIAETLGSGFQIGGVSAGEALGNNIREAAKPELNMKDAASIRNYAQWASRNGKDEEALLMQQKAAEVEAKDAQFKGYAEAQKHVDAGGKAALEGNEIVYNQSTQKLEQQLAAQFKARDFEGWKATQEQLGLLKGQQGTMQTNAVKAKAARVNALVEAFDHDPHLQTPEQREVLSNTINRMMMEPEVSRQVTDSQIQRHQLEKMETERRISQETDQYYKDIAGLDDPELIEEKFGDLSGAAQKSAFAMKEAMITAYDRRIARQQTAVADKTEVFTEDYVKELKEQYAHLPQAQKEEAYRQIDRAAKEDRSKFVNGTYTGYGGYADANKRSKNLTTALNGISSRHALAVDTNEITSALEIETKMLKAERDSLQPSETQINNIARTEELSREDAIIQAMSENRKVYRELQRQYEPEKYEKFTQGIEAGLNPNWSEEQMDMAMLLVTESKKGLPGAKAVMEKINRMPPEKQKKARDDFWKGITDAAGDNWPVSDSDGTAISDTTPANALDSNGYVTGQSSGESHPAVMAFMKRLNESNEALLGSAARSAQAVGSSLAEAATSVPMHQNPEVYGNYRQQQ